MLVLVGAQESEVVWRQDLATAMWIREEDTEGAVLL